MAATPSTMLPLGTTAPDFNLPNANTADLQMASLASLKGKKGTMVMFICNHCPYVKHIKNELLRLAAEYSEKGIAIIAINANDVANYPDDAPDKMQDLMTEWGNPFAYLFDETQEIAQAYQAACTPDFYLFDAELACVYRGRLDGSTPKNDIPLTGADLRAALDPLIAGTAISDQQHPSIGCNIKWKTN